MAYIGSSPVVGEFKKLDDISAQFNDSNILFALTAGGESVQAGTDQSVLISIDGVLQEPGAAYTISGSNITFTEAPNASSTFFGIQLGSVNQVGIPSDLSITTSKIVNQAVTSAKIADSAITSVKIADGNVTVGKIADSAVSSDKLDVDSVTTNKILNDAVTSIKISPNTILRGTTTYLGASIERANVIASNITSTVTIDNQNNGIVYYTGNSASNADVTVNFINMDSVVSGNVTSFVLMVTNNAAFRAYVGNVNINGASGNIVRWLGGVPTSGDANIDVYSFSVVKTAASSYTTLASKNNFD